MRHQEKRARVPFALTSSLGPKSLWRRRAGESNTRANRTLRGVAARYDPCIQPPKHTVSNGPAADPAAPRDLWLSSGSGSLSLIQNARGSAVTRPCCKGANTAPLSTQLKNPGLGPQAACCSPTREAAQASKAEPYR